MGGLVVTDDFIKLYEVEHPELGKLVGAIAGSCPFIGPWMKSIAENGFEPVRVLGHDDEYSLSGLFVDANGDAWLAGTDGGYFPVGKGNAAIGSSVQLAHYLLNKGKTAVATVKEVIASDLYCGGRIRTYNAKTGKLTIIE